MENLKILLASASPRRKELLGRLFNQFSIETPDADENYIGDNPEQTVKEVALRKLKAVIGPDRFNLIIASDTLVYFEGQYLGKPKSEQDAYNMLSMLSNNTHQVISGIAVWYNGSIISDSVTSEVRFKKLSNNDIQNYIKTERPFDKAGAYAIQDGKLVDGYNGDYSNIVGLPLDKLKTIFDELGIPYKR